MMREAGAYFLCINAVAAVGQAKLLQHEVPSWLQQLPNDAVWLLQVPLNQQDSSASLKVAASLNMRKG